MVDLILLSVEHWFENYVSGILILKHGYNGLNMFLKVPFTELVFFFFFLCNSFLNMLSVCFPEAIWIWWYSQKYASIIREHTRTRSLHIWWSPPSKSTHRRFHSSELALVMQTFDLTLNIIFHVKYMCCRCCFYIIIIHKADCVFHNQGPYSACK